MSHPKGVTPANSRRVRVRSRRLDQVDEAKVATALALLARRLLEERARDAAAERDEPAGEAGR